MRNSPLASRSPNRLLARLSKVEFDRLSPLLESVPLTAKQVLYKDGSRFKYVYFPTSGVVSAITVMDNERAIEVATIGNEGMTGLTALIGGDTTPYEVMVQVTGDGLRMRADAFRKEMKRDGALRNILVLYNTAFAIQVSYSVACNKMHTIRQRCCRWLLVTQDRVGSKEVPFTHELLAIMMGVRRTSVTEVLQPLQERGMILIGRGKIEVLNRRGLEATACECYGKVRRGFARLFG